MSKDLSIEELRARIKAFFSSASAFHGEGQSDVEVEYVINSTDLSKRPFRITRGSKRYHLKLTNDPEDMGKLLKWRSVATELTERYRAPKVVDWVEVPGTGYFGLLFEHIEGRVVNLKNELDFLAKLLELAARLHSDADLAARLKQLNGRRTYLDTFSGTFIRRFEGDIAESKAELLSL
jgi:hypothetical protein